MAVPTPSRYIFGSGRTDILFGFATNDLIDAGAGNDRINAGAGDDWIIGGRGDDVIIGGDGFDTAIFSGSIASYQWSVSRLGGMTYGLGYNALKISGSDGTDWLSGVEALQFDDFTFYVDGSNNNPFAKADRLTVSENSGPVVVRVLDNDFDYDTSFRPASQAGNLTVSSLYLGGTVGTVIVNGAGEVVYDPNGAFDSLAQGQTATDTFGYYVSDGRGGSAYQTVTVTILGVAIANVAPAAVDDDNTIKEATAPNPVTGNVLTNDNDADGNTLSVTNTGTHALSYGSLILNANGTYSYTLDNDNRTVTALTDGQTLTDSFTYSISDGHGGTNSADLTITINGTTNNNRPLAVADTNSVKEDTAPNPITGNVLTNDSDLDANPLTVTNAGTFTLSYGIVVVQADGSYTYTLDNSNPAVNALNDGQTLTDSFTYNISDGHGGTDSAALTITINGTTENTPPVVEADTNTIQEDATPNTVTGNVLTNDSDLDGHTLSVANAGTVTLTYGSLEINADGSYTYTLDNSNPSINALNNGQHLNDTFTYTASDGHGGTTSSTLTIRIDGTTDNRSPVVEADYNSVTEDSTDPLTGNVLTNDSDPDGDALALTNAGTINLLYGTLTIAADGTYAYTLDNANSEVQSLNDDETLDDEFTYEISDGHGGTNSSTLTITINGRTDEFFNSDPTAENDDTSIAEDDLDDTVSGNVLDNDSDVDGDALEVTNGGTFALTYGSLDIDSDGNYIYTLDNSNPAVDGLNDDDVVTDTFFYEISDGNGGTSSATLTITINGTSDLPI